MTIVLDDATLAETGRRWANPSFKVGPRVHPRVPDGWADEPYTRFGVEPMAPTIGAVITGVSLADPIDDELFAQLNRALLEDERARPEPQGFRVMARPSSQELLRASARGADR